MKYALAGLAIVAAVVALFVRPPHLGTPPVPAGFQPAALETSPSPQSRIRGVEPHAGSRRGRTTSADEVVVYVAGEVRHPGVYRLAPGARGVDALARAGGPLEDADLVAVNLAALVSDGDEIAVTKVGALTSRIHGRSARSPRRATGARGAARHHRRKPDSGDAAVAEGSAPARFDLNAADEAQLETVPGVGPGLAARIVAYRDANGPFVSMDELADVAGVSERVQEALTSSAFVR